LRWRPSGSIDPLLVLQPEPSENIRSRNLGLQEEKIYDRKRDLPISLQKSKSTKQTKITLEFYLNPDEIIEFKEIIKSNLNGTLPVCITFGDGIYNVNIVKPGRGSATLNAKNNRIASFLADRIQFQYIPAVRTARTAATVVEDIVANELRELEDDPAFQAALSAIRMLQRPILTAFSERVTNTLKAFVPGINSVNFSINDERRYSALRHSIEITIDDGEITNLESKGDGIQSLVALGIRRHALEELRAKRTYIFAIEEPEAHPHPNAIHELRVVLDQLSITDQIVLTTHSGLLVNRSDFASNILVRKSKATTAKSLGAIRESLGIRSQDNLVNADLMLIVEGDDDRLALRPILASRSDTLATAFASGRLSIDSMGGAGSLGAKVALYRGILCNIYCFVDFDQAGKAAVEKAKTANLITDADYSYALLSGVQETEFEDMVIPATYTPAIREKFGVDLDLHPPRNRKAKWSARIGDSFAQAGKPFDDTTKARVKYAVADAVAASPANAIATHAEGIIDSLVANLERKLRDN
jgi:hypothetical protein